MRVVVVSDYAHINGGAAKVAITSALALADAGHDVHLFSGVGPVEPAVLSHPNLEHSCLNLTVFNQLSGRAALKAGTWNLESALAIKKLLEKLSPTDTVVHFHQVRDALTPSVVRQAIDMNFPTLFTAHDYSIGCPYGGFLDVAKGQICHRRGLSFSCVMARCNTTGPIKKAAILYKQSVQQGRGKLPSGLTSVLYVSEFSKEVLSSYALGIPFQNVLPNPIDVRQTETPKIDESAPYVYVGNLNTGKDPVTAAKAAKIANVPIVFIGDGPASDEVKAANPNAKLLGWLDTANVIEQIRASRALVFPSVLLETQGMAAYEALANGIPVISSDTTAASEAVKASGAGSLFRAGNAEDLAQKLREYQDTERARQEGKRGYEWFWADPPTMQRHVERLTAVYDLVLKFKQLAQK